MELTNEFSRVTVTNYRDIDIKTNMFPTIMSRSLEHIMEIYYIHNSNKIRGN